MSLLGKFLAILNVLGVAGFFTLAAMDYGKRQAWAHAVFLQELTIAGLPLEKEDKDMEGHVIVEKFPESLAKELFPGGQPPTQESELERVQSEVNRIIGGVTDARKQTALRAQVLVPFATTAHDREQYLAYALVLGKDDDYNQLKRQLEKAWQDANKKPPADREKRTVREAFDESLYLQRAESAWPFVNPLFAAFEGPAKGAEFSKAFDESLAQQNKDMAAEIDRLFASGRDKKGRSPEDRRRIIARLLLNFLPEPEKGQGSAPLDTPGYQRFLRVVGVRSAIDAVRDEANALAEIAREGDLGRGSELSLFALQHGRLLSRVAERARDVEAESNQLARRLDLIASHEEQLKRRRFDVKQYKEELGGARDKTAEQMAKVRELSDQLFKDRIELRKATRENQDLYKEIRQLEQGR